MNFGVRTRRGVAVLVSTTAVMAAGCGDAGVELVAPGEAVANLEAAGTFRFTAEADLDGRPAASQMHAEGAVDLGRAVARYTTDLTPEFASQGVIAIGRELYVPDGDDPAGWVRSRRTGTETTWVEDRFLPYDAGGLLALEGLSRATPSGEDPVPEGELLCGTALGALGTAEMRYCVDDEDRLRSHESRIPDVHVHVRYDALGEPVDVPPHRRHR